MYQALKPLMFRLDPETSHNLAMGVMSGNTWPLRKIFPALSESQMRPARSKHMTWRHAVGLAAGFDKDAKSLDFLSHLGFGSIEVGTVTLKPQIGNDRPRIWRIKDDKSLRNAMGFPSGGAELVLPRVKAYSGPATLGVNIGKNKETPLEDAVNEYLELYEMFAPHANYMVINVSSPNTADLRKLQERAWLEQLLKPFTNRPDNKPLYLKISPDESDDSVNDIVDVAKEYGLSGLIATNTTSQHNYDKGGVSGELLTDLARTVWEPLLKHADDNFDIVGVGGFSKPEHFEEFFDFGGKFAQIYTAFVYQGPDILKLQ